MRVNAIEQFLTEHRETLAERGGLRGNVVGAPRDHQIAVSFGLLGEREQRGGGLEMDELQRAEDLQLLDVLRQVAACEARDG